MEQTKQQQESRQHIQATSWQHLIELLYANSWDPQIKRFRAPYTYRGLPNANYNLETSLYRMGSSQIPLEGSLIRSFKKYARIENKGQYSIWHWITLAQHHGLPTRLLDWTWSPFVAMHFSTEDKTQSKQDAAIWCVDFMHIHENIPQDLKQELKTEGANSFTIEMLKTHYDTLREFDDAKQHLSNRNFAVFFEPPTLDARIENQYALFSVISDPKITFNTFLESYPQSWKKIIIPAQLKGEIRDKLDQANISERMLFPGLDGLCFWLKRHYGKV